MLRWNKFRFKRQVSLGRKFFNVFNISVGSIDISLSGHKITDISGSYLNSNISLPHIQICGSGSI